MYENCSLIVGLFEESIFVILYKTIDLALWDKREYKTIEYRKDISKNWHDFERTFCYTLILPKKMYERIQS